MIGQLLTLPLRIGARTTQFALRTVEGVAGRATMSVLQVVGAVKSPTEDSSDHDFQPPGPSQRESNGADAAADAEATVSTPRRPGTPAEPVVRPTSIVSAPEPEAAEPPSAPVPAHVSEEPELVREEAEPGAEDGAGASVHIRPPWEGYERMGAREVITRLADADAAELAAVELYERSHRSRQTVLDAVERRLKAVNGKG